MQICMCILYVNLYVFGISVPLGLGSMRASMGVTSRSTFPVPEFRVVLHIGRILHRAWAAAYKYSEESSAELSGMKSVNEHTALLSFLEKNTVTTRNVSRYCVSIVELLSTVSIYRVFVHFRCSKGRCPMQICLFSGVHSCTGIPYDIEHWTSGTRSPPAARRESIAFLTGCVQTESHRFGSI